MYLNTGGGARDGEAFILVKHDGREDHIYGTGKRPQGRHRGRRRRPRPPPSRPPRPSRTRRQVAHREHRQGAGRTRRPSRSPGRGYADILTGSRSGLYLNTSGNVRDGEVFSLVKREGREFHIYGTGKDRQIIGLKPRPDTSDATTPATATTPTDTAKNTGTAGAGQIVDTATTTS